jgi:hypothetical protein
LLNDKRNKNTWYLRELLREGGERERGIKVLEVSKKERQRKKNWGLAIKGRKFSFYVTVKRISLC